MNLDMTKHIEHISKQIEELEAMPLLEMPAYIKLPIVELITKLKEMRDYIGPKNPPQIDWSHVHPKFKYLVCVPSELSNRKSPEGILSRRKPTVTIDHKKGPRIDMDYTYTVPAEYFASYVPGDCFIVVSRPFKCAECEDTGYLVGTCGDAKCTCGQNQ